MTSGINYCIFPNWLSQDEADFIRESSRARKHERCNINRIGWRFRTEAKKEEIQILLSDARRTRLALALKMNVDAVLDMQPRYWDSVIRQKGDGLVMHNDMINEDRTIALAYYANRHWSEEWGGEFVFHFDDNEFVIPPIPNTMVAFEVTPDSWHSVRNVKNNSVFRHAFIGWLNGPKKPNPFYVFSPPPKANTKIEYPKGDNRTREWTPGFQEKW